MTLEERKAKYRKDHGLSPDAEIVTRAEFEARKQAYRQAEQTTAVGAFVEGAADEAVPGFGGGLGVAAGLRAMSKIPVPSNPRLALPVLAAKGIGIFGTAIAGAIGAGKIQDEVLEVVRDEDTNQADKLLSQELRKQRPWAFTAGEMVGGSLGGGVGPSIRTFKGLGEIARTFGGRGKPNKEVVEYALTEIGVGGGLGMGLEGARQYSEGEFNPGALITTGIGGAVFTKPVLHGKKLMGTPVVPLTEAQHGAQTRALKFADVTDPKNTGFTDPKILPNIDEVSAEVAVFRGLTPVQQAARIDALRKSWESKKAGDDAVKKRGEASSKSSAEEASDSLKKNKEADKPDPEAAPALAEFKTRIEKRAKSKIKEDVAKIPEHKLGNLERMFEEAAAQKYVGELGKTPPELRAMLEEKVAEKVGKNLWQTVRSLAAKRNITINASLDRIVTQAGDLVHGLTPRQGRNIVLTPDVLEETPFHEIAHVWIRDMLGSTHTKDVDSATKWLTDLYGTPGKDGKELKTIKSKDEALEKFAKETGRQLVERMRNLPKGKFAQMRRWYADVNRASRVTSRYNPKNKNDILDFIAQRIEIDRNPLADNDLASRNGTSLAEFTKSSQIFDTQLAEPTDSYKATTVINGVKYESVANAHAIPKEIAELFSIPDMPKGFAKQYATELNNLKASIVNKTEYTPDLDYIQSFNLADSENYPAAYKSMMKSLQKRNTGALKQIFKMFEDDSIDIVLDTSQPDLYRGSFDENEIRINVPTIDDNFDMVLAQQLLKRHLRGNEGMLPELTGVWQRLAFGDAWFQDYEPELVTRFLNFASRHDMPEEFAEVVAHYNEQLGVDGISFAYRGRSESMQNNFREYPNKMMNQGNSLQGAMRALPDDVRLAFAQTMVNKSSMWDTADAFLADFDAMINTFGINGSQTRKQFNRLTQSPQHIIDGLTSRGAFEALDRFNTLWPRVDADTHMIPRNIIDPNPALLADLWSKDVVPFDQSKFTTTPALDAITALSEEAVEIKGLRNIFERVYTPPIPPRLNRVVDFSMTRGVMKDYTDKSLIMDMEFENQPIETEGQVARRKLREKLKGEATARTEAERAKKYKTLPTFKLREPKTWHPVKQALRGIRPVIDRIREIGLTAEAKRLADKVADAFGATLKDETLLNGQYLEKLQLIYSEVKLSPAELDTLGDFQLQRWHKHLKLRDEIDATLFKEYIENPRIRYYDRAIQNIMRDTRQHQNDIGMMVESFRDGKSILSPGKYTEEYTPEIVAQEIREIMMHRETASPEYRKLQKEAVDYWMSVAEKFNVTKKAKDTAASLSDAPALGVRDDLDAVLSIGDDGTELEGKTLQEKFESLFDKLAMSFKGKDQKLGAHKFKALRVATGKFGLPPSWVERNALQRLTRYVVRFSKDAAYFKNVESSDEIRKILGIADQSGNYSDPDLAGLEHGGPFNLKNVVGGKITVPGKAYSKPAQAEHDVLDSFMQGFVGYYESHDLWTRTFNRMVTSSWLGFGAGVRDLVSSYIFALPYMRVQDWPILASHIVGWNNAWVKSFEYGVNKTSLNNLEWRQSSASEVHDQINKVADRLLKWGGRNTLEQVTRTLQFAFGRQLTLQALRSHNTATIGIPDWTANRLLRAVDQQMGGGADVKGKRVSLFDYVGMGRDDIPPEVLDTAAAAWVEINQGTYDIRGLPKFTQRGVPSMFTSLARWSIEKSDRMLKDVWMPVTSQMDFLPLMKATFGAVLGGQAIIYLSEEIANKVQSDPKLIEAIQMENNKEAAQAILSSVAFAGYFGVQSSIVHDLVRATRYGVLEGIPGGLTFPAADAAVTMLKDFFHVVSSGQAAGDKWWDTWLKFVHNSFNGLNQTMRYASQHIMLSDEMSDFNARAQLRKFERLEGGEVHPGVPSGLSNPYTWPMRKAFQKANTISEAQRLLPAALDEAAKKAMRDHPNNPVEQNAAFQRYWKQLYNLDWSATPAMPDTRDPVRHLRRMRYLGLKGPPEVHRGKGDLTKTLGKTLTGDMQRGTIISKRRAKQLMEAEKAFYKLKEPKKGLVLRAVGNKGRAY